MQDAYNTFYVHLMKLIMFYRLHKRQVHGYTATLVILCVWLFAILKAA